MAAAEQSAAGQPVSGAAESVSGLALAKVQAFFQSRLRAPEALCASAPADATFAVRVRLGSDGTVSEATMRRSTGHEPLDADLLGQAQALVESHARITALSPEEAAFLASRNLTLSIPAGCRH